MTVTELDKEDTETEQVRTLEEDIEDLRTYSRLRESGQMIEQKPLQYKFNGLEPVISV